MREHLPKWITDKIIIPTLKHYEYSFSFCHDEAARAYLSVIKGSTIDKNRLNIMLMRMIFTIRCALRSEGEATAKGRLTISIQDLGRFLGRTNGMSDIEKSKIVSQLSDDFEDVRGVIAYGPKKQTFRIFTDVGYDAASGKLEMGVPYFDALLDWIRDERGTVHKKPAFSYLLSSEIARQRDKAAISSVIIILTLIEQAGSGTPHISLITLEKRNPLLEAKITKTQAKLHMRLRHIDTLVKYMKQFTKLDEYYEGFTYPDTGKSELMKELEFGRYIMLEFKHTGKRKGR